MQSTRPQLERGTSVSTVSPRVAKKSRSRVVRSPTPTREVLRPQPDRGRRHREPTRQSTQVVVGEDSGSRVLANPASANPRFPCDPHIRRQEQLVPHFCERAGRTYAGDPRRCLPAGPARRHSGGGEGSQGRIQPARRSIGSAAEDAPRQSSRGVVKVCHHRHGTPRAVGTELITSSVPAAPTCHGGLTWSLWGFGALAQARPTRRSRQCDERLRYRSARHESPLRRCVSRRIAES